MKTIKKLCQATLNLVLVISMVLSTGITGVFADEISTELTNALNSQEEFVNVLTSDIESYQRAIEVLEEAEELNGDDQVSVNEYIDYLIENSTEQEDIDALTSLKALITKAAELNAEYSNITIEEELAQYNSNLSTLIVESITEENDIDELAELYANIITIIPDVNLGEVISEISSTELSELVVNGLELDVTELENTVYVGYEVTELEVIATAVANTTKVEVIKPNPLEVGNNEVKVVVSTLSGEPVEYILNVVRLEEFVGQGDGEDEKTEEEPKVEQMVSTEETPVEEEKEETVTITYSQSNTTPNYSSSENTTEEKEEVVTEDKEDDEKEYDEEVEEDGLNGFTVLLIVGGIALIGFGIYMLFGDKEEVAPVAKKSENKNNSKKNSKKKKNK